MKEISVSWLATIQLLFGLQWLHSGWGKWAKPDFINNIGSILQGFASKTPHQWYGDYLTSFAVPNAALYGNMVRIGEMAVALGLIAGAVWLFSKKPLPTYLVWLLAIACFGGFIMNLNFFLASGSTSPSAWGLNALMGTVELTLGIFYISNRKQLSNQS